MGFKLDTLLIYNGFISVQFFDILSFTIINYFIDCEVTHCVLLCSALAAKMLQWLPHPTQSRHGGMPLLLKNKGVCSIPCCVWGGVLLYEACMNVYIIAVIVSHQGHYNPSCS